MNKPRLKSLCVFCGTSAGTDPRLGAAAARLGLHMARAGVRLIYGGGELGLMGILARAVIAHGGHVTGIIPEHLTRVERAYDGATEMLVVDSMHTRKQRMFELADAFAVLPGGMGTLDETFEILTWKQLRLHTKPVIVVNQNGYWRKWLELVAHVVDSGYAHPDTQRLYAVVEDVDRVLAVAGAELESSRHGEPRRF